MQWMFGVLAFRRAPATHASVLPAPDELPISRISWTPGVAATSTIARENRSSVISGGMRRSRTDSCATGSLTGGHDIRVRRRSRCGLVDEHRDAADDGEGPSAAAARSGLLALERELRAARR